VHALKRIFLTANVSFENSIKIEGLLFMAFTTFNQFPNFADTPKAHPLSKMDWRGVYPLLNSIPERTFTNRQYAGITFSANDLPQT